MLIQRMRELVQSAVSFATDLGQAWGMRPYDPHNPNLNMVESRALLLALREVFGPDATPHPLARFMIVKLCDHPNLPLSLYQQPHPDGTDWVIASPDYIDEEVALDHRRRSPCDIGNVTILLACAKTPRRAIFFPTCLRPATQWHWPQ